MHPAFAQRRAAIANFAWGAAAAAALVLFVGGYAWNQRDQAHEQAIAQFNQAQKSNTEQTDERAGLANRISEAEQALLAATERTEQERTARQAAEASLASERAQILQLEQELAKRQAAPDTSKEAGTIANLRQQIAQLETQQSESQSVLDSLTGELSARDQQLAALERAMTDREQALSLVRAPDVGIVDLFAVNASNPSSASVFWDSGLKHCYLHARALPKTAAGERYALWVEYEGGPVVRVADFRVDERGDAEFYEDLPAIKGEIVRTFVTLEKSAGVQQPSNVIVLEEAPLPAGGDSRPDSQRKRYRRRAI